MTNTNFTKLTESERANTYGGFLLGILPGVATLISTVVTAGIAIYHAVKHNGGSASFGGSKTITEKPTPAPVRVAAAPTKSVQVKTHVKESHFVRSFSAY